ncbi:MAG: M14 family metallocarboxypeptidase [Verrucomicrobia bacterium]|nr:M14 family metallocarboxypeptidase [Verrucomicrobiota bacterium]
MNVATSIPPAERAVASEYLPVFAAADRRGVPPIPTGAPAVAPARRTVRSIAKVLEPLERWARDSRRLVGISHAPVQIGGEGYSLPRYLYVGRKGGGDLQRIGIFATLHGDEPEGVLALGRFLQTLEDHPEIAEGYAVFLYPLCNPTGYQDGTRHNRAGVDLNREFWKQSPHPEVRFLESEIWMQAFDGIITLHSDDTSQGLYGFVKGSVLSEHLLQPALLEAGRYLPRNHGAVIDGFDARSGIIHNGYPGMLQSIPGMSRPPFEITLETPQRAPLHRQVDALVAALQTILVEYRYLQAIAQNI